MSDTNKTVRRATEVSRGPSAVKTSSTHTHTVYGLNYLEGVTSPLTGRIIPGPGIVVISQAAADQSYTVARYQPGDSVVWEVLSLA